MFKKFVVALVKPVDFRQTEVSSQKISQRTLVKPVTVETPLASRGDEPVKGEHLEDFIPACPLSPCGQFSAPKSIQTKLLPQFAAEPTRSPLTRMEQAHARKSDRHDWYVSLGKTGWRMVFVKKSDLRRLAGILTEEFDRLAPGGLLSAIELAKVKHLPLENAPS